MKRLNVKLLAILAIVFVVLTTGVVVVHGIQMRSNSDSLIQRAEAVRKEDPRAAFRFYALYHTYKPDDLEHFADFALVAADVAKIQPWNRNDFGTAIKLLEQVLTNPPAGREAELRKRVIELDMLSGSFADAKEHLSKLKQKGQGDADSDFQYAQCLISTGDYMKAVQLLETLVGYDSKTKTFDAAKATAPHELKAYAILASVLRERVTDARMTDRNELADKVITQAVAANTDSAKAYLLQAQYLKDHHAREGLQDAIEKAQKLAPNDADVLLQATEVALIADDFPTAENYISKGIDLYPKDDRFWRLWVVIAELQKDSATANERLEKGLALVPDSPSLLELFINRQIQKGAFDEAEKALIRLSNSKINKDLHDFLESQLWFSQGKFAETAQRLETLKPKLAARPDVARKVDMMLTVCYQRLNQFDKAYGQALSNSGSIGSEIIKADALKAMGKIDEALKLYESIFKALDSQNVLDKFPQVSLSVLELRIANQASQPEDKRDWSKVDQLFAKLRQGNVLKEPAISIVEAQLMSRKGELEQARQLLQNLRTQFPNDPQVLAVSAGIELQDKKIDAAMKLIDSAPPELKNSPVLIGARMEALFAAGGPPDEIKASLSRIADGIEKLPDGDRVRLYVALGTAYLRLNDAQLAQEAWKKAAALQPSDSKIRWAMFELAHQAGDLATLKELQTWFDARPSSDNSEGKLAEATILTVGVREAIRSRLGRDNQQQIALTDREKADLLKARQLLREISSARSGWAEEPKLLAEIDSLEGRTDAMIADLRKVLELGGANSQLIKQIISLLHYRQRDDEAEDVLDKYGSLVSGPDMADMLKIIKIKTGNTAEAVKLEMAQYDPKSSDWQRHLFHGQVMYTGGKSAEAEAAFRKAVELAPDQPQAWLALITELAESKNLEGALQEVNKAKIALPEDRRALVLAQGYEKINDQTQAEQYYQAALEAAPKDTSIQKMVAGYYLRTKRNDLATKLLEQMMAATPDSPVDQDNIGWARRVMAQVLATQGTYPQFQKALQLLSTSGDKPNAEDLSAKIGMLFDRTDATSTRECLRLLEQLKQLRPLTWKERLSLANLYERLGKESQARSEMLDLLASKPDTNVYIAYIEMLLRQKDVNEAASYLQSIKTDESNALAVAALTAKALTMQGRTQEAAAKLISLVPTQRPLPQGQSALLGAVASDLEQIGQLDQAEKFLREYVSLEPSQILRLAGFLARRGKIDTALDLAEPYRSAFPASEILEIASTCLQQTVAPAKPEQVTRVEQWFNRALQEEPESAAVLIKLAGLRDFQGKTAETEKLYRTLLARNDLSPTDRAVILNNLAFMLAMQNRNTDEALKFINEAINLYGPQSDMLDTRGVVSLIKGDYPQAVKDLTEAVVVTNPAPAKFVHLAMAQAKSKDLAGARLSLEKAKKLNFKRDDLSPPEKPGFEELLKQLNFTI